MSEENSVLLELERLRGAVLEGFAALAGRLDASLQRTEANEKRISALEARVAGVERRTWMLAGGAGVLGAGGAAGLWQLLGGG